MKHTQSSSCELKLVQEGWSSHRRHLSSSHHDKLITPGSAMHIVKYTSCPNQSCCKHCERWKWKVAQGLCTMDVYYTRCLDEKSAKCARSAILTYSKTWPSAFWQSVSALDKVKSKSKEMVTLLLLPYSISSCLGMPALPVYQYGHC